MSKTQKSASTYLERHLEPINAIATKQSTMAAEAMSEWRQYETTHIEGVTRAELITGNNRIRYAYKEIGDLPPVGFRDGLLSDIEENPHDYRELISAEIENSNTEKYLNLLDKLPEGWRVFIDVQSDDSDAYYPNERAICISRNLSSSQQFYTLAHEIGHVHGGIAHPHLDNDTLLESNDRYHARILRNERNAHSFALKHLRHFLSADPTTTTLNSQTIRDLHVHAVGLGSYSQFIRNEQSKPLRSFTKRMGQTALTHTVSFLSKFRE